MPLRFLLGSAAGALVLLAGCSEGTYDCAPSYGPVTVHVSMPTPARGTVVELCFVELDSCQRFDRFIRADLRNGEGTWSGYPDLPFGHTVADLEGVTVRVRLIAPAAAGGQVSTRSASMTFVPDDGGPCSGDEAFGEVTFAGPDRTTSAPATPAG